MYNIFIYLICTVCLRHPCDCLYSLLGIFSTHGAYRKIVWYFIVTYAAHTSEVKSRVTIFLTVFSNPPTIVCTVIQLQECTGHMLVFSPQNGHGCRYSLVFTPLCTLRGRMEYDWGKWVVTSGPPLFPFWRWDKRRGWLVFGDTQHVPVGTFLSWLKRNWPELKRYTFR